MFSTDTSEASYDQLDFCIMQTHILSSINPIRLQITGYFNCMRNFNLTLKKAVLASLAQVQCENLDLRKKRKIMQTMFLVSVLSWHFVESLLTSHMPTSWLALVYVCVCSQQQQQQLQSQEEGKEGLQCSHAGRLEVCRNFLQHQEETKV